MPLISICWATTLVIGCGQKPVTLSDATGHFRNSEFDETVRICDELIDKAPNHAEALLLRGRVHVVKGLYARAIEDFDRAILANEENPEPYYHRAIVYEKLGKSDLAERDRQSARERDLEAKKVDAMHYATMPSSTTLDFSDDEPLFDEEPATAEPKAAEDYDFGQFDEELAKLDGQSTTGTLDGEKFGQPNQLRPVGTMLSSRDDETTVRQRLTNPVRKVGPPNFDWRLPVEGRDSSISPPAGAVSSDGDKVKEDEAKESDDKKKDETESDDQTDKDSPRRRSSYPRRNRFLPDTVSPYVPQTGISSIETGPMDRPSSYDLPSSNYLGKLYSVPRGRLSQSSPFMSLNAQRSGLARAARRRIEMRQFGPQIRSSRSPERGAGISAGDQSSVDVYSWEYTVPFPPPDFVPTTGIMHDYENLDSP